MYPRSLDLKPGVDRGVCIAEPLLPVHHFVEEVSDVFGIQHIL